MAESVGFEPASPRISIDIWYFSILFCHQQRTRKRDDELKISHQQWDICPGLFLVENICTFC